MFPLLFASLVLVMAEPAASTASETTPPASAVAEEATPAATGSDKDRLVCRRESRPNTRFTSKVCKTVAEWEARSKTAQEAFEDVRGRPMVKICSPTAGCD